MGAAALLMIAVSWMGAKIHVLLAILLGGIMYLAATIFLGVFTVRERKLLAQLLPTSIRTRITSLESE